MIKSKKDIIAGAFILFFLYALFAPIQMSRYTLSDGKNTVVFQSMIHIGEARFYKDIEIDAKKYTDDRYTFLYEGVRPGKIDTSNKADVPTYNIMGYALGLSSQNDGDYFKFVEDAGGINADVDSDWVLDQFAKHHIVIKNDGKQPTKEDIINEVRFIKAHRTLISAIGVPMTRISTRFGNFMEYIHEATNSHSNMMEVILVERNKVLYNNMEKSGSKIYINYGALHFANLYDLMKKNNSNWHIVETKNFMAF